VTAKSWVRPLLCLSGAVACLAGGPSQAKNVDYLPNPVVAAQVAAAILGPLIGQQELAEGSPLLVER
jgi:hypothetical protein